MTRWSITSGKSVWARAAAWLAAYAFVLQTVLAPIAAPAATGTIPADAAQLVLCAEHAATLDQNQSQPVVPNDHDAICKFCVSCPANALLAPEMVASAAVVVAVTPIHWQAVSRSASHRDFLGNKQARGPPTLT